MEITIYLVQSDVNPGVILDEFDYYNEAVAFAKSVIPKKPYIEAIYLDDEIEGFDKFQGRETVWSWEDFVAENPNKEFIFEEPEEVQDYRAASEEDDFTFKDYLDDYVEKEAEIDYFDVDDVDPSIDTSDDLFEGYSAAQINELNKLGAKYGINTMADVKRCMDIYKESDPLKALKAHAAAVGADFAPTKDPEAFEKYVKEVSKDWDPVYEKYDLDRMVEDLEKFESLTNELRTWVCVFNGNEVGTVEASSEEEAYEKMEATWPELHYGEYDGVAEVFPKNLDEAAGDDSVAVEQEPVDLDEVKDDLDEVKDKLDDTEDYEEFISVLKDIMKNPAQHKALAAVFDQLRAEDAEVEIDPNATVPVKDLIPTQSEIDVDGVLSGLNADSVEDACAEPACQGNMPIVLNGKYILDGHHRWCRAYALNKDGNIAVINCDFGADADPLEALKKIQTAIAATESSEELPSEDTEIKANIYTMEDEDIEDLAGSCVSDECAEKIKEINPELEDQKAIYDYITKNCIDLKNCNQPIEGAQPRWLMPQATEEAVEAVEKGILTEETDENGFTEYDEPTKCEWCGEVFAKDQLRKEVNLGYLCSRCEGAIKSRGEKLTFVENDYFDYLD